MGSPNWQLMKFPAGSTIFAMGEPATSAFIIESGKVELHVIKNNEKHVLATIGRNELFGEMALLDKGNRSASAVAVEETSCKVLHQKDFDRVLNSTEMFLKQMILLLSKRLRDTNQIILS